MKVATQTVRILATLTCALWISTGNAGEKIDRTLAAASTGTVKILNVRGEVEILGWDRNEIAVEGELDDLTEEFIFEIAGDRARIEVRLPRHNVSWGDGSDLQIHVPENSKVDFEGVSTDVIIDNILGGIRARSVSGEITAENIRVMLHVKSVSGDIEISDSSGVATVSTVSGEIELDMASSRVVLDTVSGDIDADLGEFTTLRANAVSGGIEVAGKLMENGTINISGVSSDVVLRLMKPVNARLRVSTGPGGDIVNHLTDDDPIERFPARMELDITLGSGKGDIKLRTVSGDVRIDEAS